MTRYLIIDDPKLRAAFLPGAYHQQQVVEASALIVMLAKEAGVDTITMSGFDSGKLKEVLNISDRYLDVMLIAIGKGIKDGHPTVRHPVERIMHRNAIM
ncbi:MULTISPECIES: nitroreductase family protein [Paenibacillus]|uniref:Nitroreductase domain-containing protein n=1 Tax=Paenibacillus campinasensis TaxID=66347 RepID=A0ABW9SYX9_9BACL|nr:MULTISPECIES: nitroreductase family protein [Paenibacillus]MUG65872.1 hypothetical protein [Paenibacillus campinasensis]